MTIIAKYFEKKVDYINVMKVSKRYHDLVQMYHFNPIQDYSLFENIETQYIKFLIQLYEMEENTTIGQMKILM